MENASKALLMAGGVLVGMLVMAMAVILFTTYGDLGKTYEQTMSEAEIQKFNSNFTKFEGRTDITVHEILTLAKFAKEYEEETGKHIIIRASTAFGDDIVNWLKRYESNDMIVIENLVKRNLEERFEIETLTDRDGDGMIDAIKFKKT